MKQIYKRYLITIGMIWAACAVLFVFTYMIFVSPQETRKQSLQDELKEKEQLYRKARRAAEKKVKSELSVAVDELEKKLTTFTINPSGSSDLIFDIGQIAGRESVQSFSVQTRQMKAMRDIPQAERITKNDISINFLSEFPEFAKLLNSLERHDPVVFIDKFKITRSRRPDISNSVNMDLKVFVRKTAGS